MRARVAIAVAGLFLGLVVSMAALPPPPRKARAAGEMAAANVAGGRAIRAAADNAAPPQSPVKLIFIHHSCGENWLQDGNGNLGLALRDNNYFVSDTNYGWGPDEIGSSTDIGQWWTWFRGPSSPAYTAALYAESGQNCSYSRLAPDPGGENEIVMFKSCFPNSALEGSPSDPAPPSRATPSRAAPRLSPWPTPRASTSTFWSISRPGGTSCSSRSRRRRCGTAPTPPTPAPSTTGWWTTGWTAIPTVTSSSSISTTCSPATGEAPTPAISGGRRATTTAG